jgi:uncharacterized protein (DUF1800 family)
VHTDRAARSSSEAVAADTHPIMRGSRHANAGLAQPPTALGRRTFLRKTALGAAVGGATLSAAGLATLLDAPSADAASLAAFVPADQGLHLLRRATWGPTPSMYATLTHLGRTAWLDRQLAPSKISDTACDALIAQRFPRTRWSISQAIANLEVGSWDVMMELSYAAIARATWSNRQLFEVMVDFWSNHLNVTNPSSDVWATRHDYDRVVIRAHALGKFHDLLVASATHPAMLLYLNNAESSKYGLNENYGRELLELHTVGVDAGYSETDMVNSAMVMTGFGIDWTTQRYLYTPDDHYTGRVTVMSWTSANTAADGRAVAMSYLHYLSHHPSTAKHIATQLCERFVSDTPPASLVSKLAATYLANDTAIVPVLRRLFSSSEFQRSIGAKVRRPMEDMVATLRILGVRADVAPSTDGIQGLYWMVQSLGHAPMAWAQPNGYPDTADAWRSAGGMLGRWNMHMSLAGHWWPDQLRLPPLRNLLPSRLPSTYGAFVDDLASRLVFRKLTVAHRNAVCAFLGATPSAPLHASDAALGWRLPYVVSLILDTPYFMTR